MHHEKNKREQMISFIEDVGLLMESEELFYLGMKSGEHIKNDTPETAKELEDYFNMLENKYKK